MARPFSLLMSVLLAFFVIVKVEAKSKADQIRLYDFTSDYCTGHPKGANIDLKRDKCVNIDSRSVKPVFDPKRKKWLDDVNLSAYRCFLMTYDVSDCPETDRTKMMELPHQFNQCFTQETLPIRSVKFVCGINPSVGSVTSTITTTIVATSWSAGEDGLVTASERTKTLTVTTTGTAPATTTSDRLESRADDEGERTAVWLYHPWSRTPICYECFSKALRNFSNFKCRSGPKVEVECPQRPIATLGEPITTTASVLTTTSTITGSGTYTYTTTSTTLVPLEARRSWQKSVDFRHPWSPEYRVCADAKWEKRGKSDAEIRLQDIKVKEGDDCKGAESLDLPDPITNSVVGYTTTVTSYTASDTTTITTTTRPNVITTTIGFMVDLAELDEAETEFEGIVPPHGDL